MDDAFVRRHFRLDGVLTTVDALHALGQLREHPESVKQIAVADRLILTKRDLVTDNAISDLRNRLSTVNPGAPIIIADHGEIDPTQLFNVGIYDPASKGAEVTSWINAEAYGHEGNHHENPHAHRHNDNIQAHCLIYDQPLNWRYFSPNLTSLVSRHAEKLLRVKGILNIDGEPAPVVIHGVQHQFARMRLKLWPSDDRRSKLVLIARGLNREFLADWLSGDKLSH
jgi:G3E family GTPase